MLLTRMVYAGLTVVLSALAAAPLQAQPAPVLDLQSAWDAARVKDPSYQAALAARRAGE